MINDIVHPFFEDWELDLDFDRFIEDGNTIVVLADYNGGPEATRKSFSDPTAHVWDLEDGESVRFRQYVNVASLRQPIDCR